MTMIRSKRLKEKIINANYPVSLLTMLPMRTKNTIIRVDLSIKYDKGLKYISDDFYKRISTIEEP